MLGLTAPFRRALPSSSHQILPISISHLQRICSRKHEPAEFVHCVLQAPPFSGYIIRLDGSTHRDVGGQVDIDSVIPKRWATCRYESRFRIPAEMCGYSN